MAGNHGDGLHVTTALTNIGRDSVIISVAIDHLDRLDHTNSYDNYVRVARHGVAASFMPHSRRHP
jgi:hypothetical protein